MSLALRDQLITKNSFRDWSFTGRAKRDELMERPFQDGLFTLLDRYFDSPSIAAKVIFRQNERSSLKMSIEDNFFHGQFFESHRTYVGALNKGFCL
jgi:hypothetical protein